MRKIFSLKRNALLAGILLLAASTQAQSSSILWKVTKEGAQKPTYIFGTIHSLPQSRLFFPPAATQAFSSSDRLVLEIDMDNAEELALLPSMIGLKGKSVKDYMTPEQVKAVSQYFADSVGIPFEQVAGFKPFVFTTMLLPKIVGPSSISYEQYLLTLAKEKGKPVDGIETVEEQVGAIDKLPIDQQVKQLVELVTDMGKAREEYQQLLNAYLGQHLDEIAKLTDADNKDYPLFNQLLITERNASWIPRLEKIVSTGGSFVAVGAGHLPGKKGIIELLQKQGYTVTPISM